MNIKTLVLGPLMTNTYLLTNDNQALLVDPAGKSEKLIDLLSDYSLVGILLTHGHFDHIKAVDGLYDYYHCPVYLNLNDEQMARDKHSGAEYGISSYITCPLNNLNEGKMKIGQFEFEVIYTPGHTPGSVIFVFDEAIFTGDTLFKNSVGRSDLPGGNGSRLRESLRIFKEFDKDYQIYPGHDCSTHLYQELANNPFLR